MALGEVRYVERPLYEYVQHGSAALGHAAANAAGRYGGSRRARAARGARSLRGRSGLAWRRFYFDLYCRVAIAARTLELRCGPELDASRRRTLRRIGDRPSTLGWLGLRSLRPVLGRNETLARERAMLSGLLWRRGAELRARRHRPPGAEPASQPADPDATRGPGAGGRAWLEPILVDYFSRDGSTLMMRMLATAPEIVVEDVYPYERRYLNYLWRWSALLDERDWDGDGWDTTGIGSIARHPGLAMLGPPPWKPPKLLDPEPGEAPIGRRAFELVWEEFSARVGERHRRDSGADPHYIAEKHLNTWAVDLAPLPDCRLVVLLRDPRDTWVSINSFSERRGDTPLGRHLAADEDEHLAQTIDRHRHRLRWIVEQLEGDEVELVRYTELIRDPEGVAGRLSTALGVTLDPAAATADENLRRRHVTAADPEASIGRWRTDLDAATAERMTAALRPELEALGFDT